MSMTARLAPSLVLALGLSSSTLVACDDEKPAGPAPSRFNGVKREQSSAAQKAFCEVSFPGPGEKGGETGKKFVVPVEKPIPGRTQKPTTPQPRWRWVNLWATWCHPCIEEIGLLAKWEQSLAKDGMPIDLELYSVDDDEAALTGWLQKKNMPGSVRWLKGGGADLPTVLETLGVDKGAPIPVHALVDPAGNLRCVRTGSVSDQDYGAVKSILAGS